MNTERKRQLDALYEFYFGGTKKASEARGATEEEIKQLIERVGKPLPQSYLDWLRNYDNMADVIWGIQELLRNTPTKGTEHYFLQQELYEGHLLIGGEGEAISYNLDVRVDSPDKMRVTEWNEIRHEVTHQWEDFDAFLDALVKPVQQ